VHKYKHKLLRPMSRPTVVASAFLMIGAPRSEPTYSRGFKCGLFNLPAPGSPAVAPAVSDIVATFTDFPRFV
jgi:hypothetical protein